MKIFLPLIFISTTLVAGIAGIGECEHLDAIGIAHWYNWSPSTAHECASGFVPMVRDAGQAERLRDGLLEMQQGNILLGFNEPDQCPYQACISPLDAVPVEHWRLTTYTNTLHASPAPSQENINWLPEMRNFYIDEYGTPPAWDYISVHCYMWDEYSLRACKTTVNKYIKWSNSWGAKGVIVTEFASFAFGHPFNYAPAVIRGREFIRWMNEQDEIKGYFWFSAHDWDVWGPYVTTALFDDDENLTPLGEMYRDEVIYARRETK